MVKNKTNRISRREAFITAAGLVATPALVNSFPKIAYAAAPMLGKFHANHHRIKLGDFEITTILFGTNNVDGPHPIFGQNASAEEMSALMEENHLPTNKFIIGYTPVVINTGNELVLVDTGLGAEKLVSGLESAGYTADQIDVVAITHFHPDHINGTIENGQPTFPNARYVTSQKEFDFWGSDDNLTGPTASIAKLTREKIFPFSEKMTFIGDEGEVVSGINGFETLGHMPGHMSYHVESKGKRLLIWGDVANHYVASIQRPDWHVRFDFDKEQAAATRKRVFDMLATDEIPVSGYHMPFPSFGFLEKSETSYRWVQESYQLDL